MANLPVTITNTMALGPTFYIRNRKLKNTTTINFNQSILHILNGILTQSLGLNQHCIRVRKGTLTQSLGISDHKIRTHTIILSQGLALTSDNSREFDSTVMQNSLNLTDNFNGTINIQRTLGSTGNTIFDPTP